MLKKMTRRDFDVLVPSAIAGALLNPFDLAAAAGLRVEKEGGEIRFATGSMTVARIPAVAQGDGKAGEQVKIDAASLDKILRTFQSGPWEVSEQIRLLKEGFYEWKRTWKNRTSETVQADLCMEIESGYSPEFTLIPGISYDGNPKYGRRAAKGLSSPDGKPWVFTAFKANVPAGNYSEGSGWSIFLFTSLERKSLYCAFSMEEREQRLAHRLLWPERDTIPVNRPPSAAAPGAPAGNQPRSATAPGATPPAWTGPAPAAIQEKLSVGPGEEFAVTAYFVIMPAAQKRRAFAAGLDHAWRLNRRDVKPTFPVKRLWDLGAQFARESLWYDQKDFVGFSWGLDRRGDGWVQRHEERGEQAGRFDIGWCNQGAGIGAMLLQDYVWNKNQESLTKGERALDFWAENGRLPNGLFHTHWDGKLGMKNWGYHNRTYLGRPAKPGEYYLDCTNLGFGCYYFLLASEIIEKCGKQKPVWRKLGLDMCDFFVDHALSDGTYGKAWSVEGECLAPDCTTGAHILWPMMKAYQITRNKKYLESARRAFQTYLERDLDRFICTGSAVDADTIDREAAVPMLIAALDLYDATGSKEYIRHAELAAYYLASWQYHYALPFHPDSPLVTMGYEWFGGTSITVMAQAQDPWASIWAWAWLRLAKLTGNDIWRDRAIQAWNQGTYGISDGTMVVKGAKRPIGSQSEGYSVRLSAADGRRFFADPRDWLVAWPMVHRGTTLINWPNWKDFGAV